MGAICYLVNNLRAGRASYSIILSSCSGNRYFGMVSPRSRRYQIGKQCGSLHWSLRFSILYPGLRSLQVQSESEHIDLSVFGECSKLKKMSSHCSRHLETTWKHILRWFYRLDARYFFDHVKSLSTRRWNHLYLYTILRSSAYPRWTNFSCPRSTLYPGTSDTAETSQSRSFYFTLLVRPVLLK